MVLTNKKLLWGVLEPAYADGTIQLPEELALAWRLVD